MIVRFKDGRKFDGVMSILFDRVSGWYMRYLLAHMDKGKYSQTVELIRIQLDWIDGIVDDKVRPDGQ